MSKNRGIVSRLFEGLGRITWGVGKRKLRERRAEKHNKR